MMMMTHAAIAKKLGLTIEEVLEAERTGMSKCVQWCKENGIDPGDFVSRCLVEYHTPELFIQMEDD